MRTWPFTLLAPLWLATVCTPLVAEEGFRPLFDGKTLAGWRGDPELWSVEDGTIVGSTDEKRIAKNSFLSTEDEFENFVLELKFKLRNGNSGVQVRSRTAGDFVVHGYQADIAEQRYMGILYDEGGRRGILADVDPEEVQPLVRQGDWNEYRITVDGPRITLLLNGHTTVDFTETEADGAKRGIIALQLHVGPPMRIAFKDIQIKPLP